MLREMILSTATKQRVLALHTDVFIPTPNVIVTVVTLL